jgi:putative peptidoglycan lipid II flippase
MLGGGILGSRGLGLVRDIILAYFLGTGHVTEAWFVANRIPHFLRFHLTEGSLNAAFVPVFSEYLEKHGKAEAKRFASAALSAFALLLLALVIAGIIASPLIVRVIAPGFQGEPGKLDLSAILTSWNFAYLFLVAVAALGMAMLQALGHFKSSAASQLMYNVCVILAAFTICPLFGDEPERWIIGIMVGVILAGILQLAIQIPPLVKRGMLPTLSRELRHPGVVKTGRLILPTLLAVGVGELVVIVNTLLASLVGDGGVAAMEYAVRIVYMPQSVCASALAVAIVPYLSRQATRGNLPELKRMFSNALRVTVFLMTPIAILTAIMSTPVVRLLLEYGRFTEGSTAMTATAMRSFAPFLIGASLLRIATSAFFSLQDTKTPAKMAVVTLVVNASLGVALVRSYGVGGLALAASLAPLAASLVLLWIFVRRNGSLPREGWGRTAAVSLVGGGLMAISTILALRWVTGVVGSDPNVIERAIVVGIPALAGGASFLAVALALRARELEFLLRAFGRRGRGGAPDRPN